ncbi:hypothetical protein PG987_016210 [Apiospora arundinis]
MPVTELAYLPLLASSSSALGGGEQGCPSPAFIAAAREILRIQADWCAENPTGSSLKPADGAGLFVQVDDPLSLLLTAHWDSPEHHGQWIRSQANRDALGLLAPHLEMSRLAMFHVDGVEAFTGPETVAATAGEKATLSADYVSVSKFVLAAGKKADFEGAWNKVGPIFQEFVSPYVHRGGWRIEKQDGREDKEEFVLIGGWDSLEKAAELAKSKGYAEYGETLKTVTSERDTKLYRRIL